MKTKAQDSVQSNLYKEVTLEIVELLKAQQLTWDKPWIALDSDSRPAHNAVSGRHYSGLNQILLSIKQGNRNYPYSGWLTFSQVNSAGGFIQAGERASKIVYLKPWYIDHKGNIYSEEEAKTIRQNHNDGSLELTKRFVLRYYNVFNVRQTSELPPEFYLQKKSSKLTEFEKDRKAEDLINRTGAVVSYDKRNNAYYDCLTDVICLPQRTQFKGKEAFYETALHELGHWTGHEARLGRKIPNPFGTTEYAKEELVAELCSAFLCTDLGFSKVITNNAAYIQDWIKVLSDDHRYIIQAT